MTRQTIIFLTLDDVLQIHELMISRFGGSHGMRDQTLLESALQQPQSGFGGRYLHNDIYEMAAAYIYHIIKNHPFIDGNKRTGIFSTINFLELNGCDLDLSQEQFYQLAIDVATSKMDKQQIAQFFRDNNQAN